MNFKFEKRACDWSTLPITSFEQMYGVAGTHIPTQQPRTYIGVRGEILIDDEIARDQPYAKIGDGEHSFEELDYVKVLKDYYCSW